MCRSRHCHDEELCPNYFTQTEESSRRFLRWDSGCTAIGRHNGGSWDVGRVQKSGWVAPD